MQNDQHIPNLSVTPRIITSYDLTPLKSQHGTIVRHGKVLGQYALAKRVTEGNFSGKGLVLDSEEERETYRRKMLAADLSLVWKRSADLYTDNLRSISADQYFMPLPRSFAFIAAASPFFRVPDIISDYQGVVEVPWIERSFQSSVPGVKLTYYTENLREGSYIQLYDIALSQRSNGLDAPHLHGQIHKFIGFDDNYVVASIFIFTFYRYPSRSLTSYSTGKIILAEPHQYEQTIILLRREHCRINSHDLLEYSNGELTGPHYYTLHSDEKMIECGPERLWTKNTHWKHPFEDGTKCKDHYRVLEEEERIGRGQLFQPPATD